MLPFSKLTIRNMVGNDIFSIETIHKQSFSGLFLDLLGAGFLYKYFNMLLDYKESINLVSVAENTNILGYIVGARNPKVFYRTLLLRHFFYLASNCIFSIIKKPRYILNIVDALLTTSDKYYINSNSCMIFTIAVSPEARGSTVASDLIEGFVDICRNRGIEEVYLNVDTNNKRAISFYEKIGFNLKSSYKNVGKSQMKIYSRDIRTV